ncbi:hypothetical protein BaRGS_00036433 [Batillaria attramentaria]|uniref:Uncharacterized protein n=1 Tax=Batillaria attramentaria TaxID=370345 RepID=A0ABD0JBW5_9CAEN|nr:hypothetical protein BaRGS_007140 [Batillaria attramentaria]
MAANAENFRDTVARHTEKHGETVLNFLRQFDETDADNPDVKQKAVEADTVIGPSDTLDENTNGEEANKGDSLRTDSKTPSNSSSSNPSAVRFFVTSDSAKYMRKAEELFGNRFIRTEGRFVHVDHTGRNSQMACDGFTKLLVDQELLVRCDVLVISMSGFGRQAAARRGTSKGLYCILMNGTLVKCSPDQLKELYHIRG